MPIKCSNCNQWNRDNAKYCVKCKQPLGAAISPIDYGAVNQKRIDAKNPKNDKPIRLKKIKGEVCNKEQFQDRTNFITTFLVETFDTTGNRLVRIPVEINGHYRGIFNNGDQVEINQSWKEGQIIKVSKFFNLSIGCKVWKPGLFG